LNQVWVLTMTWYWGTGMYDSLAKMYGSFRRMQGSFGDIWAKESYIPVPRYQVTASLTLSPQRDTNVSKRALHFSKRATHFSQRVIHSCTPILSHSQKDVFWRTQWSLSPKKMQTQKKKFCIFFIFWIKSENIFARTQWSLSPRYDFLSGYRNVWLFGSNVWLFWKNAGLFWRHFKSESAFSRATSDKDLYQRGSRILAYLFHMSITRILAYLFHMSVACSPRQGPKPVYDRTCRCMISHVYNVQLRTRPAGSQWVGQVVCNPRTILNGSDCKSTTSAK